MGTWAFSLDCASSLEMLDVKLEDRAIYLTPSSVSSRAGICVKEFCDSKMGFSLSLWMDCYLVHCSKGLFSSPSLPTTFYLWQMYFPQYGTVPPITTTHFMPVAFWQFLSVSSSRRIAVWLEITLWSLLKLHLSTIDFFLVETVFGFLGQSMRIIRGI